MSDESKAQMTKNAQEFMSMSQKILEEAMATCQMEAFNTVPLAIPANITAHSLPSDATSQEKIWQQINQLYASQENLFAPSEPATEPDAVGVNSEVQLTDISKMLGM